MKIPLSTTKTRKDQDWLRISSWVFGSLLLYLLSAFAVRILFDRGLIKFSPTLQKTCLCVYAPFHWLGEVCPPFLDAFEWCVTKFEGDAKK